MKKLLVAAIGLGLAIGTVSFAAAQDTSASTSKPKKAKKSKKSKKSSSSDTSKM